MPIELPNLDDKTYADLVQEARAALPGIHPGWTDHNPSDPGIALIELFAWLSEMLIYRTGRIPETSVRAFLRLLDRDGPGAEIPLEEAIRQTMLELRTRWRAVTPDDYEHLAMVQWPGSPEAQQLLADLGEADVESGEARAKIALKRARCVDEQDLSDLDNPVAPAAGHVSLVVAPWDGDGTAPWLSPTDEHRAALEAYFRERRVVTTRLHITGPRYVRMTIEADLYLRDDANVDALTALRQEAAAALYHHFHPWTGGRDGHGWPFDRDVHFSDVYAILDGVRGVESVKAVTMSTPDELAPRAILEEGEEVAIRLDPHELPRIVAQDITFRLFERRLSGLQEEEVWVEIEG